MTNGGQRSRSFELAYSWHALYVMAERTISPDWVERTVAESILREDDPYDPSVERFYRAIPERGNCVLRVAVNTRVAPW